MYVSSRFAGMGAVSDVPSLLDQAAARYGLSPAFLRAVASAESGYNPAAVSSAGAQGVMQLMPGTAKQYGVTDSFDPAQNIDGGAHLLSDLLKRYNGDESFALAAYNAGPGNVAKYGGIPPFSETQNYVQKIMAKLGGGGSYVPAQTGTQLATADLSASNELDQVLSPGTEGLDPWTVGGIALLGAAALWAVA